MDNIQLILYIVFLIGYFLFKLLTGKKNVTRQDTRKFDQENKKGSQGYPTEYEPYSPEADRPKSFEEILEELARGPASKEEKRQQRETEREVQRKQQDVTQWELSQENENIDVQNNEIYQKSIQDASKYTTLDERIDLDNLDLNVKEVEEIGELESDNVTNQYLSMFATLEDAKKAVVLTEIFNRKYN